MKTRPFLTLDDVRAAAAAAEAEALKNGWAVTIAICDDGGHLLWLQRLDGAAPISAQIAPNQGRTAFLSAPELQGMLEGGMPILAGGHCVGAVGVSGVKSAEDAQVARAGVAALAAVGG